MSIRNQSLQAPKARLRDVKPPQKLKNPNNNDSHSEFSESQINPCDSFAFIRKSLSVLESFYIFVAEFGNKLKKGGNGKQKIYCNELKN